MLRCSYQAGSPRLCGVDQNSIHKTQQQEDVKWKTYPRCQCKVSFIQVDSIKVVDAKTVKWNKFIFYYTGCLTSSPRIILIKDISFDKGIKWPLPKVKIAQLAKRLQSSWVNSLIPQRSSCFSIWCCITDFPQEALLNLWSAYYKSQHPHWFTESKNPPDPHAAFHVRVNRWSPAAFSA